MKRNYIDGRWVDSAHGQVWVSRSPADSQDVLGEFAEVAEAADAAVAAARKAAVGWEAIGLEARCEVLARFEQELNRRAELIAETIAREVGKPLWESIGEARALGGKIGLTLGVGMESIEGRVLGNGNDWREGGFRYRPLGVCVVLGPFNFPLHLANGHIIAALATGNSCIFKPSELAPACAELYMEAVHAAGFPAGVFNMVQGRRAVGERLVASEEVDAILFTGSVQTGLAIRRATVEQPSKLLALEMGGKNTAIVLGDADLDRSAYEIGLGALLTAGQRCSGTSRVVVARSLSEGLIERLERIYDQIAIGHPLDDGTFMGPLINEVAVDRFLLAARTARAEAMEPIRTNARAEVIRDGKVLEGNYVKPAMWRATLPPIGDGPHDAEEIFGPDLVIHTIDDGAEVEELAAWANATPFGLAMSVFTRDNVRFEQLAPHLRCGILNINRATVGASGLLPFGGVKMSGNHRPAASLAPRYCTFPVSTLSEEATLGQEGRMARFPTF